ncbi:hypothetical protein KAI87_15730, partial [Myxococcota bacterium]|nr:hypothetical protein [Myxococcota bacterium]
EQGRVFYYSAEGKSRAKFRQFGFDKKGRRLDFSTAWRKNVQSDLAPIDSAVSRAHNAATAIERLEAAGQCKKLLKNCVELFSEATNGPGARLDATFETFWGELTVDSIGTACTKEAKLLKSGAKKREWLAQFELIANRAASAMQDFNTASANLESSGAAKLLGRAQGGFAECTEQAKAIQKNIPRQYKKEEVASIFGELNPKALERKCKSQLKEAHKLSREALLVAKKVAFIAKCKGDEVNAVEREGIPTSIKKIGSGRVLIWKQGRREKRIAFDKQGMRTTEALLRVNK